MKNAQKLMYSCCFLLLFQLNNFANVPPSLTSSPIAGGAYLTFAGKVGGDLTKDDLKRHSQLGVEGCAAGSKIIQYSLIIHKGKDEKRFAGRSDELDEKAKIALQTLEPGDSFEFENVKAFLPNGKDKIDVFAKKYYIVN